MRSCKMTTPKQQPATDSTDRRTALITGASSGIGRAFAQRLAAKGFDLILVARRRQRLERLRNKLQSKFAVGVEVCPADLADAVDVARLEQRVAQPPGLAMLVNNAGFGVGGTFVDGQIARHLEMIHVHVVATVRLTKAALPGMIARGAGSIVNVSSMAAFVTGPGSVTYSATKAYLNSFSQSLQSELAGTGVRVQALCPGFTYTEFHDSPEYEKWDRSQIPGFLWMRAERVVEISLRALPRGKVICVPGLTNRLLAAALRNRPLGTLLKWLFRDRLKK